MKRSLLGAVALGLGGSVVAGFGASAGRDLWRGTKKNSAAVLLLLAVVAAFSMPFLGVRNFVRGHAPAEVGKYTRDIFLVTGGWAVGYLVAALLGSVVSSPERPSTVATFTSIGIGLAMMGSAAGFIVGAVQRPGTQRRYAIAVANEVFLDSNGFEETGESEITHFDGAGNALRLTDRTENSIVFIAVGKRNKRAYITLSPTGEMQNYTGVVSLGSSRQMDGAA